MRHDWDARALADPLFHVDATKPEWAPADFYARGREIVESVLDPVLRRYGVDPSGKRVLDVGCGVGRFFEGLSLRFADVWGIDVSARMLEAGERACPATARWILGDGRSLAPVESASVDHVISYEMLQHVPDPGVVSSYVAESHRVLRPGGVVQLHLRGGSDSRRQAVFRLLPRSLRVALIGALRALRVVGVSGDPDTWLGCIVPPDRAVALARRAGFADVDVLEDNLHTPGTGYWLAGRVPG
jgi:SAM-dependent methyltransferase